MRKSQHIFTLCDLALICPYFPPSSCCSDLCQLRLCCYHTCCSYSQSSGIILNTILCYLLCYSFPRNLAFLLLLYLRHFLNMYHRKNILSILLYHKEKLATFFFLYYVNCKQPKGKFHASFPQNQSQDLWKRSVSFFPTWAHGFA